MRVTVLYFAAARERAGVPSEAIELAEGATAAQALALVCERHPALQAIAGKLRVAVDEDFSALDRKLREGSEVALIPPVSGGAGAHRVSREKLSAEAPVHAVEGADCGAVVSFLGTVRSTNRGKTVVRLRVFDQIASTARERWQARLAIHHRIGALEPGELSVVIAAAAPHRADAFEACRFAIESLKKEAPIWKHEIYPDGSSWVGLGS